jgi:hypothetical protein
MTNVVYPRLCAPSGAALEGRLAAAGYAGPTIQWGTGAHIVNKLEARIKFRDEGVSAPRLWVAKEESVNMSALPVVGRRSNHRKGRGFFIVEDEKSYLRTRRFKNPPSHYIKLLQVDREFRVHVVNGSSIKISEKIGGEGIVRSFENGFRFAYPADTSFNSEVRELAKRAVSVLDYPFGAVDVLLSDGVPYVTEVNAAPCLTSASDTLQRYVNAFMKESNDSGTYAAREGNSNYAERLRGHDEGVYASTQNHLEAYKEYLRNTLG